MSFRDIIRRTYATVKYDLTGEGSVFLDEEHTNVNMGCSCKDCMPIHIEEGRVEDKYVQSYRDLIKNANS
jgi:hypothetical protein